MSRKKRVISVFLMVAMLCSSFIISASAEERGEARASLYFTSYALSTRALGSGQIKINLDIIATRTMYELGVSGVMIYEKQSDGKYIDVYTFGQMTVFNDDWYIDSLVYQGVPGRSYYARVSMYARDSRGSETLSMSTNVSTAT